MQELPTWMRGALYATAAMNAFGAVFFFPTVRSFRDLVNMPEAHTVYLATISMFIALFGAGYLWCAIAGRADRMFITLAAVGKIGFFSILTWLWYIGQFDPMAPLLGAGDLVFGLLFVAWLAGSSPAPVREPAAIPARR